MLIISCPGSGKTTTLLRRIRNMIRRGVRPSEILMVTFTNAAAGEMRDRYAALYGRESGVVFLTLHSLCFNILRMEGLYETTDLLSEHDKRDFLFRTLKGLPGVNDAWELSLSISTEITSIKNNYTDLQTLKPESCEKKTFLTVCKAYEKRKQALKKLDFDDMLLSCLRLLKSDADVLARWQDRFRYVQCDEYQDTNSIQRDILYLLTEKSGNLCVVGDDDQSVYRFRGAHPEIMLDFPKDFPNCTVIHMDTNYRSCQAVVNVASRLISFNKTRFAKDFISERGKSGEIGKALYTPTADRQQEMSCLARDIEARHGQGVAYRDMAVLFRTNRQAALPVDLLLKAEIPCCPAERVTSIYDGWIFAGIRSYIALSTGTGTQTDFLYVLNRPQRFLSEEHFRGAEYSLSGLLLSARYLKYGDSWKYEAAEKSIREWMRAFGPGKISFSDSPQKVFSALTGSRGIHYEEYLRSYAEFRNIELTELISEFEELQNDASRFATVGDWLSYAKESSLAVRNQSRIKDKDGIVLSTMHRAKGLEWDTVFVIDVNFNIVPHRNSKNSIAGIEEERRLLYVAMTRAKNELHIYSCGRESEFMEQLAAQDRKESAKEPAMPGQAVMHRSFGRGTVTSCGDGKITVRFEDKERAFLYPGAIEAGYMRFIEEDKEDI